ncbi:MULTISPECIES: hypothetical protein [unclassified Saccharothrix]|uniref:hypothetical protein n=1 Tax=unclassified Saccharothrix TaxID=2593673 RepID=UPI00307D0BC0
MTDTEDELRRLLAARADRVHSHLTGPAIRARAAARPRTLRRLAPLVSAVAVVLAVAVASLLLTRAPGGEDRPATSVPAGGDPRPTVTTTTPDRPTTSPPLTTTWTNTTTNRPNTTTTWPALTTTR